MTDFPFYSQNLVFVEALYQQYQQDPASVDPRWRDFFQAESEVSVAVPAGGHAAGVAQAPSPTTTVRAASAPDAAASGPAVSLGVHEERERARLAESDQVLAYLNQVPLFELVSAEDLRLVASITQLVRFDTDGIISQKGQAANDFFYIIEGRVAIIKGGVILNYLEKGEMIGELAVFDDRPRSATMKAASPCVLLHVPRVDLYKLMKERSSLDLGLVHLLAARLRDAAFRQEAADRLVNAYRERGHVKAHIDPLGLLDQMEHPELTLEHYGFREKDLDLKLTVKIGQASVSRSLRDIITHLEETYCRSIGVQYMHVDDLGIQEWIRLRMEDPALRTQLSLEEQKHILKKLTDAETFENFLHRKFVGAKRFSLEGAESLIPLLENAIEEAGDHGLDEVIIGMAHRGRLNVLVNIMGKPASQVFREFKDQSPDTHGGRGDVKYHLGYGSDHINASGKQVHLSLCFNPSHLEFVGPVVLGRARAKQDRYRDLERARALPLLIHGDAAFAGQGVVQEMLNLSELRGYRTGGTVHIILNNQIGFTTDPDDGRSTQYATDVARMLQIPIFHVNGEDPDAVARAIRIAMDFRKEFQKDIVIDMYSYRKYGHNEGDDPVFTQPLMYQNIKRRPTVREAYVKNLLKLGGLTAEEADRIAQESKMRLEAEFARAEDPDEKYEEIGMGQGLWQPYRGGLEAEVPDVDTRFDLKELRQTLLQLTQLPETFTPHSKIKRFLKQQQEMAEGNANLNWGVGEALALASLLKEGYKVRVTGQDAERGTFSHRHAVLHDAKSGELYTPLSQFAGEENYFAIFNSPLSEVAVLGFEYGFSLDTPDGLTIWEAQFGDFSNVAQVIIDQFITSSEEKWRRLSGLCLFLPHGFEGQGPEHSSARLERFLMLAADDNIQVVNLTTPAQLFHCLRRQVKRSWRKPLVMMSPKSLLRHPRATSRLEDLAGGSFLRLIGDAFSDPDQVDRILLCSGKVYYELEEAREKHDLRNVAILRLEQYYPFPHQMLNDELARYKPDTPVVWVQEEPHNMGAWPFLKLRFGHEIVGNGTHPLACVSRQEAASPATGSAANHRVVQEKLILEALGVREKAHQSE
ncbi:Oxoglutarate dehydrogenase (succinyl-transferring) [Sulfidibacter corallicola]|uniref:oxoglutarate dehydrogenase (succinyl-transferring) n=1 Tax=Sulfidibacter corallicola TaxID=2818388 RepID=A0A8A4TK16_SULCO|nr:2-oxoglutarate dehydrogenase E1 component [Sulfidibacter corallicola]QTD49827.1 2-oxoglutarate dehydrogenase E1 component [Sulfidibacter corallicola]